MVPLVVVTLPWLLEVETTVTPVGRASTTVTPVATTGPRLEIVSV